MGNCCCHFKSPSVPVPETNASLEKDKEETGSVCGRRGGPGAAATAAGRIQGSLTAGGGDSSPAHHHHLLLFHPSSTGVSSSSSVAAPNGTPAVVAAAAAASSSSSASLLSASAAVGPLPLPPTVPLTAAAASSIVVVGSGSSPSPSPPRARGALCPSRLTPRGGDQTPSDAKIHALFDVYRDAAEDAMLADGIERLCADLALKPDEFKVLVLAWRLRAARMCRFSREEFVCGLRGLRCDSLRSLRERLPEAASEAARDADLFKDLYRFTFRFGLDADAGQRALPVDMATVLWRLVFAWREPPVLRRWLLFLECQPHVRAIPRDTWNMFLNFADAVGDDLSSYDDSEAWPSLFDDFVEYENDKANQNVSSSKDQCEGGGGGGAILDTT